MHKQWNAMDVLKHSRHDWLNQIQLIKGNLSLNRIDRVHDIINEMISRSKQESILTNIKATQFGTLLVTYNWESSHSIFLEYEITDNVRDISRHDEELVQWFAGFLAVLEENIAIEHENHVLITIELLQEEPRFFLDFRGTIKATEAITHWLENKKSESPSIQVMEQMIDNEEIVIVVQLNDDSTYK